MRETILSMLRCPQCGSKLRVASEEGRVFCINEKGGCTIDRGFPLIHEQPALVVFERSVLDEASLIETAGKSVVRRQASAGLPRRIVRRILRFLQGVNRIAEPNARRFLDELHKIAPRPVVLIVGGGTVGEGTRSLVRDPKKAEVVCFDVYATQETDFIADAHDIPLAGASVDGVWIQAVLEHTIQPERVVAEIHRVLKPGGIVYAEIPFMQTVHEGAYDFTRFTDTGTRWLFRWYDRIDSGPVLGPGSALLWIITATMTGLFRSQKLGKLLATLLFFWVRFFDCVIPKSFAVDAACGLYFLGRKADVPISPKDAVRAFQGVSA